MSDSVFRLYYYLMENKRQGTHPDLPDIYLLDILYTKWWSIGRYNFERLRDFKTRMEMISEKPITDEDLTEAIAVTNENRRLLQELNNKRLHHPPMLSGTDAVQFFSTTTCMKKIDHSHMLKDFLKEKGIFIPKPNIRLMFSGNSLDHIHLYRLIEDSNMTIIIEDHDWGYGYAEHLVDDEADPMSALSEKYHLHTISPRVYPASADQSEPIKRAIEEKVDGTVFFIQSHDAAVWDYPERVRFLEENGIKTNLNLQTDRCKELFFSLLKKSDFLLQSFEPGYLDSLGLNFGAYR